MADDRILEICRILKIRAQAGPGERRWIPNDEMRVLLQGVEKDELATSIKATAPGYIPGTVRTGHPTTRPGHNRPGTDAGPAKKILNNYVLSSYFEL